MASEYFRSGADKISIGSDAVYAVEEYLKTGTKSGKSSLEQISHVYGNQAVVVSVDPRRVYVASPGRIPTITPSKPPSPAPTARSTAGTSARSRAAAKAATWMPYQLVTVCEKLGAGEILLNCMDRDGTGLGFDLELTRMVKESGHDPGHRLKRRRQGGTFFRGLPETGVEAALAAGIFHRREVPIEAVKAHLQGRGWRSADLRGAGRESIDPVGQHLAKFPPFPDFTGETRDGVEALIAFPDPAEEIAPNFPPAGCKRRGRGRCRRRCG